MPATTLAKTLTALLALQGGATQKQTFDAAKIDWKNGVVHLENYGRPQDTTQICTFNPGIAPLEIVPNGSGENPTERYDATRVQLGQNTPTQTVSFITYQDGKEISKQVATFPETVTRFQFVPQDKKLTRQERRAQLRKVQKGMDRNITSWVLQIGNQTNYPGYVGLWDRNNQERIEACQFNDVSYLIEPISSAGKYHYTGIIYHDDKPTDIVVLWDINGSRPPDTGTNLYPGLPNYVMRAAKNSTHVRKMQNQQFVSKFQNRNNKK